MFKKPVTWLMLIQLPFAWEWLKGGWDKIMEGGLGSKFAESLPTTLSYFTKQPSTGGQIITNPHHWYVDSFINLARNNSMLFGYLIAYSELLIGLVVVTACIYYFVNKGAKTPKALVWLVVVALVGAIFMNINFYLAAGWAPSAISTAGLNTLMALGELVLLGYYITLP